MDYQVHNAIKQHLLLLYADPPPIIDVLHKILSVNRKTGFETFRCNGLK